MDTQYHRVHIVTCIIIIIYYNNVQSKSMYDFIVYFSRQGFKLPTVESNDPVQNKQTHEAIMRVEALYCVIFVPFPISAAAGNVTNLIILLLRCAFVRKYFNRTSLLK